MGLGERAKPSNSSVSTTRIRPLSGPHWPWMLLQALSALRSGPRLQHLGLVPSGKGTGTFILTKYDRCMHSVCTLCAHGMVPPGQGS